jgi:hypothetical protein
MLVSPAFLEEKQVIGTERAGGWKLEVRASQRDDPRKAEP